MPSATGAALYDRNSIALLEPPLGRKPYRVRVTFVEPFEVAAALERSADRFLRSFGAGWDDQPVEATLVDIHERLVGAQLPEAWRCSSAWSA